MPGKSPLPRSFPPTAVTARQREVIRLRALGTPVPEIARRLGGVTESAVWKLLKRALAAQAAELRTTEAFEAALALHVARYEMLLSPWMPKAIALDKDAADVVLKILSQIADVSGFKSIKLVPDTGPADRVSAPAAMIASVLDRLEQLHERHNAPPATIDGETVEEEQEVMP